MLTAAGRDYMGITSDAAAAQVVRPSPQQARSDRRGDSPTRHQRASLGCARIRWMNADRRVRPPYAVLWDLDGVLVDTRQHHLSAFQHVFGELGHELTEEQFQGVFGLRNDALFLALIPDLAEDRIPDLSRRKERYYLESLPERVPLLPGARRLVMDLDREGIAQAVASSTPRGNLDVILPRLGLPLEIYVGAEDVEEGKPQPDVFLVAAARLGMPSRLCLVVEDSRAGIEGARRAAMASLAVATTWPAAELSEADMIVHSLEEVTTQDLARLALRTPSPGGHETE